MAKFEFGYTKQIEGSRWKCLVSIYFDMSNIYENLDLPRRYTIAREDFLEFMAKTYGPQDKAWSVRWTDLGADVRFENDSDAASFMMFYTKELKADAKLHMV